MDQMSRRAFLAAGAASGSVLLVGVSLASCSRGAVPAGRTPTGLGAFVAVYPDGRVLVTIPVPEIGQGVRTSLAMLVAEELDVPWSDIRVEQADARDDLGPHPRAAGSWSVRAYWLPLREAGARARALLVEAAAREWSVAAATCRTRAGVVYHGTSGRRARYGTLVPLAATLRGPDQVALKDPSAFRIIGQPTRNLDALDIVRGQRTFGIDTSIPGMWHAVVLRSPVYGGALLHCDPQPALAIPGVRSVVVVGPIGHPEGPTVANGIAVLGDTTWAAIRGRDALRPEWAAGPHGGESTASLEAACRCLLQQRGRTYREHGDVEAALRRGLKVEAEYQLPLLAHVPMEPPSCTAIVSASGCEIWAPTQMPVPVRRAVADHLGLEPAQVRVHVTAVGGGFGRRLDDDFVLEAVEVARAAGVPVKVTWTRTDDLEHGFFRPFSRHRLSAGLDGDGKVMAWRHRQAGTSRYAWRRSQHPGRSEFLAGVLPAALVPNARLEYAVADFPIDRGPLRAPGNNSLVFVTESFVDELAHAAGVDPLGFRLRLLGPDRTIPYDEDDPVVDTGRMRAVLERAARRAGWGTPLPPGRGRGIASAFVFGTYVAHVAEASVNEATGVVWVHRVTSAMDCGMIVNPLGARAQVEGAVVDGLSALFHGEITIAEGRVQQTGFGDYPLLRIGECPVIDVELVASGAAPTGAGEPPYPPVAPAVANAVFAAAGVRLRQLPLRPPLVLQALAERGGRS